MRLTLRPLFGLLIVGASLLFALAGCAAMKAFTGTLKANPKTGDITGTLEGATGNFYKGLNITAGNNSGLALIVLVIVVVALPFVYPVSRKARLWAEKRRNQKALEAYRLARTVRLSGGSSSPPVSTLGGPTVFGQLIPTSETSLETPPSKPSTNITTT